jgi:PII-like signaling protein
MDLIGPATKVTIYIGESDRWHGKPLHMAILELLKSTDCAGATVTRGIAGFGCHSRIRTASIVDLSADLPLIVEWVDEADRVDRVMPQIRAMVVKGMITVQRVEVIANGPCGKRAATEGAESSERTL